MRYPSAGDPPPTRRAVGAVIATVILGLLIAAGWQWRIDRGRSHGLEVAVESVQLAIDEDVASILTGASRTAARLPKQRGVAREGDLESLLEDNQSITAVAIAEREGARWSVTTEASWGAPVLVANDLAELDVFDTTLTRGGEPRASVTGLLVGIEVPSAELDRFSSPAAAVAPIDEDEALIVLLSADRLLRAHTSDLDTSFAVSIVDVDDRVLGMRPTQPESVSDGTRVEPLTATGGVWKIVVSDSSWPTAPDRGPLFLVATSSALGILLAAAILARKRQRSDLADVLADASKDKAIRERRFDALVNDLSDLIIVLDDRDRILYASPSTAGALGRQPGEVLGKPIADLLVNGQIVPPARVAGDAIPVELAFVDAEGLVRNHVGTLTDYRGDEAVDAIVWTSRDQTEQMQNETRLTHDATHDPLTGLPNRTLLFERLDGALAHNDRGEVAVLFVDLDRFKGVNDRLGHTQGDRLLIEVAERLRRSVRARDTVGRFGGDEFVVICDGVADRKEALRIAAKIRADFDHPITVDGHDLFVGASVGLALASGSDRSPDELIRDADAAMYQAKEHGRSGVEMFTEELRNDRDGRLELDRGFATALDSGELEVALAAIRDLDSDETIGYHSRLYWRHQDHGLLDAAEFVDSMEDAGTRTAISRWFIGESLRTATSADPRPGLVVHVALTGPDLDEPDLDTAVGRILERPSVADAAAKLCLELDPLTLLRRDQRTKSLLTRLRQRNVAIGLAGLGDIGVSLHGLRTMPIDVVKLSPSLVAGVGSDAVDDAFVHAVTDMAAARDLVVIATGVESDVQRAALVDLGCHLLQEGTTDAELSSP